MTTANIKINRVDFHVTHDGDLKDELKELMQEYINEVKGLVDPSYIATAVINQLIADSEEPYAWIQKGLTEYPDHVYEITIDKKGKMYFREVKKRRDNDE
jgi:predicted transcriptional regulator